MSRSKSGTCGSTIGFLFVAAVAALATVSPCDDEAENEVQSAEAGAEDQIADRQTDERRQPAEEHEADAHQRDEPDGERAAADERRSVQQQPRRGKGIVRAAMREGEGEHRPRDERREVADEEPPRRAGHEWRRRAPPL